MLNFVLRRIFGAILSLWAAITLTFLILYLTPGDPAEAALSQSTASQDSLEQRREALGLDLPLPVQYGRFLLNLARGDLGISWAGGQPVSLLVGQQIGATISLAASGMVVALISGVGLGLSAAQRSLLNREGDHHQAELLYTYQLCENQWLAPTLQYDHYGLDGGAMRNDMYSLMLTHTFATNKWRLISNLIYGFSNYDERNPIYQKTCKADRYGVSTTLLVPNFCNVKNMTGLLGVAYLLEDANINFYDTEIIAVTASTMYTF